MEYYVPIPFLSAFMESAPSDSTQKRFESAPESLKPGNILTYHREDDDAYFISQFGWKVETLPEGTRIRTKSFPIMNGVAMPEGEGKIIHKDGKTLFLADNGFVMGFESKFFHGDVVEIVALPDSPAGE